MASIIQEGQMSAPIQGGLFQGKNFWLSARVPSRNNYIQQIKVNGGNVVHTEKEADVLIVDHLRDHSADTAFSYKFIEKSIQNKKLEDLEDHLVPAQKKKAKASGLKSRSNFTQEDDDILFAKLASVDSGHNGNKIYHELHEKYPHHTMHSWRGRWVDHFSKVKDSKLKLKKLKEKMEQELEEDLTQSDEESEPAPARNSTGKFTKEDEAMLRKMAVAILKDRGGEIYQTLSKENPNHTPEELEVYFTNVLLPRISLSSIADSSNEPISESKDRHNRSEDKEKPIDLTDREKVIPKSGQGNEETTSGSVGPKRKRLQPPVNTKSPLRTMSVRESPRSWSKEGNKQLADLQPHRSTANSSTGKITPARSGDRKAIGETITTEILQNPSQQAQGKRDEIQTNKNKDPGIALLSHDKLQFDIAQNNQKRKREKIILTPEQRKRKRDLHGVIESTPEAESTTQSRRLSPELGDSSQRSSPPVVKDRKDKKYGEMSTQALYDQLDEKELLADMDFPQMEPSSSPSSPLASLLPEEKSTPSSKLLPKTPVSAWASSPNSPDSASVKNMSAFLDYCQKKFMTSEKKVVDAIERTSGNRLLVEVILGCDVTGEALPDYPGIWTAEQDKLLLGADSKVIKALAETKGEDQMLRRMEFLNKWNLA